MSFPDDIIVQIFDFVGSKNFLYLGTVNHQFYKCYPERITCVCTVLDSCAKYLECMNNGGGFYIPKQNPFNVVATSRGEESIKVSEFLLNDFLWDPKCVNFALSSRNFQFLNWVIHKKLDWNPLEVFSQCVIRGDIDGMKYLHSLGYHPDECVAGLCAEYGERDIIDWLVTVGCPVPNVVEVFASNGDLYNVVWANVRHSLPCTKKTLDAAACSGNEWLVDYILNLGIKADIETLECACVGKDCLAIINLLQEKSPEIFDLVNMDAIGDLYARYNE